MSQNNSDNFGQHLFYIGDNVSEEQRNIYSDCLIFDRERNSIYAQNHEFGYICDYENSIDLRNADGTNKTTITLSVVNGQIALKEYRSVLFTQYTPEYTQKTGNVRYGNTFVLGSTVELSKYTVKISGSEKSDIFSIKDIYNTPNSYIVNTTSFGLVENTTYALTFNDIEFTSTSAGSKNILTAYIVDPKGAYDSKTSSITWLNHVMVYKYKLKPNGGDFYALKAEMEKTEYSTLSSLINAFSTGQSYNTLSSTHKITINLCENGPNEYLVLCCPVRTCNTDGFTGILGGAAVQEFKKIKTVSYTNSASYTENYNIYLATGHNWNGQSLKIQ